VRKKSENLLILALTLLTSACLVPDDPDEPITPDPIGARLLHTEGTGGFESCRSAILYRDGRALQYQCFTSTGAFSYENLGTLSPDGAAALDAELLAADLDDTEPGNFMGLCVSQEAEREWVVWVGERSVKYSALCPTKGMEALNALMWTLYGDIDECEELDLVESVEPGCRPY
jgi:hypothetical protein